VVQTDAADPGEHAIEMGTSEPYLDKHHVGGPSADHGPKHEPGRGHDTAETQGGVANWNSNHAIRARG